VGSSGIDVIADSAVVGRNGTIFSAGQTEHKTVRRLNCKQSIQVEKEIYGAQSINIGLHFSDVIEEERYQFALPASGALVSWQQQLGGLHTDLVESQPFCNFD